MREIEGFTPFPQELVREYREKGCWRTQTLGDLLDESVRRYPDKEALVDEHVRVTYREYGEKVDRLALRLLELGLKPGQMLTLQIPNWVEYCYFFFACAKIGVIAVLGLPQHRSRDMEYILNLTESVGVVIPWKFHKHDYWQMIEELRPRAKSLRHVFVVGDEVPEGAISVRQLLAEPSEAEKAGETAAKLAANRPDPADLAFLMWTGGTTSFPKGVPRMHEDYILTTSTLAERCDRGPDVPYYLNIPIAHNIGTGVGMVTCALHGAKLVMSCSPDTTEFLQTVEREKIGAVLIIPTQVVDLLNHPNLGRYDLSSLKTLACGGANFAPELVRGVRDKIGCRPVNVFGMAEGPTLTTRADDPFEAVCDTVGTPTHDWDEIRVVDDDDRPIPVGEEGEVVARGPDVIQGYFKAPEVNREAVDREGWFHSGDYGRFDENGRLRITGRKKDMILRGGENIAALEVEHPLLTHPKVQDIAVVAMPDPRLGERVCAFIRPREGQVMTLDEVRAHLEREGVAKYKWPERVELMDELPLTNVGKIAKNVLRERIKEKLKSEGGDLTLASPLDSKAGQPGLLSPLAE